MHTHTHAHNYLLTDFNYVHTLIRSTSFTYILEDERFDVKADISRAAENHEVLVGQQSSTNDNFVHLSS